MEDAKVDAFVTAQLSVSAIHQAYAPVFEAAGTEEERLKVRRRVTEAMVTAVNETPGITVDEFNAIIDAASADPRLADQLNQALATALQ